MTEQKDMSEAEAEALLRSFSQGQQNVHSFFTKVIQSKSTTKTGNLSEQELGISKLPVRTLKELELFSIDIIKDENWGDYFKKMSEIQTSTSLSKDALLLRLSVTSKKELADMTPQGKKKANKGWFTKRDNTRSTDSMNQGV